MKRPSPTHSFIRDSVVLRKRGQITLPKKIRNEDGLKEDDVLDVIRTPGGDTILRRKTTKTPEDEFFEFVETLPHFDLRKAWEEVRADRRREDR